MRIEMPHRPRRGETIIPMINVVFLLLIFFLLSARLTPPEPFQVIPPQGSAGQPAEDRDVLFVSASGELAYGAARGAEVWPAIAATPRQTALEIRADARAPAALIARLLRQLAEVSPRSAELVVGGG